MEDTYRLTPDWRKLFDQVLRYARETVRDSAGGPVHQRVRWWSILALLRAMASSPAAAAATLRNRSGEDDVTSVEEADIRGQAGVLDLPDEDEAIDGRDTTAEALPAEDTPRARLLRLAKDVDRLRGARDAKIKKGIGLVRDRVEAGEANAISDRTLSTERQQCSGFTPGRRWPG